MDGKRDGDELSTGEHGSDWDTPRGSDDGKGKGKVLALDLSAPLESFIVSKIIHRLIL